MCILRKFHGNWGLSLLLRGWVARQENSENSCVIKRFQGKSISGKSKQYAGAFTIFSVEPERLSAVEMPAMAAKYLQPANYLMAVTVPKNSLRSAVVSE
jgi:hypothetical protein